MTNDPATPRLAGAAADFAVVAGAGGGVVASAIFVVAAAAVVGFAGARGDPVFALRLLG